jgi:hypothetical protein
MHSLQLPLRGRCQCGVVSFQCTGQPFVAYTCHCLECQRLSSSAFNTCIQVAAETVAIASGEPRARDRTADSGNVLSTYFCGACGSAIFSQNSARPRIRTIYVGTLNDAGLIDVRAHIWVKRKLPWVVVPSSHRIFNEGGDWTVDYAADITRYKPPKEGGR